MMDRNEIGKLGEQVAANFLRKKGCEILQMNYHSRWGEVDIISESGGFILFCEVKTRAKNSLGTPAEAVNFAKQKKLIKTAYDYLMKHQSNLQPRFDVIEVVTDAVGDFSKFTVNHIENAFILNDFNSY